MRCVECANNRGYWMTVEKRRKKIAANMASWQKNPSRMKRKQAFFAVWCNFDVAQFASQLFTKCVFARALQLQCMNEVWHDVWHDQAKSTFVAQFIHLARVLRFWNRKNAKINYFAMVVCDSTERGFNRISRSHPMFSELSNGSAPNVERSKIEKLISNFMHTKWPEINAPRRTRNPWAHTRFGFAQSR